MPVVHVPAALRAFSGDRDRFEVEGTTLGKVFAAVASECPELVERIIVDGEIRPEMAVAIDGSILEGSGLIHAVLPDAEIYLVPPIGGGSRSVGAQWRHRSLGLRARLPGVHSRRR